MRREATYELSIGDDAIALRRRGGRSYTTARILGRSLEDGVERVWLDRVIAPYGTTTEEGWRVTGAVSSVLVRVVTNGNPATLA